MYNFVLWLKVDATKLYLLYNSESYKAIGCDEEDEYPEVR